MCTNFFLGGVRVGTKRSDNKYEFQGKILSPQPYQDNL